MLELYHAQVHLPAAFARPIFEGRLNYGAHAKNAAKSDRYGHFELPECFFARNARLIEAELDTDRNIITKQVWRQQLDSHRDLVLVINRDGFVRTVWINLRSDRHTSLNTARYVRR